MRFYDEPTPPQHPIYAVISERSPGVGVLYQFGLPRIILDVIECDITDVQQLYNERVGPLQSQGRQIQMEYYTREPATPFRLWQQRPKKDE